MSTPVSYDVKMTEIAAHCLDVVAAHVGVPVAQLQPTGFQVCKLDDGSHVGRVMLASKPVDAAEFEPGAR